MQILLGMIVGAVIGLLAHVALPQRVTRGAALGPLVGAAAAAVAWTALTWAGWGIDNPLLWLSALVVPALVTVPTLVLLARSRVRADDARRAELRLR